MINKQRFRVLNKSAAARPELGRHQDSSSVVAGPSEWVGPVSMALDWHAAKSFLMCNTASFMLSWCSQRERGGV